MPTPQSPAPRASAPCLPPPPPHLYARSRSSHQSVNSSSAPPSLSVLFLLPTPGVEWRARLKMPAGTTPLRPRPHPTPGLLGSRRVTGHRARPPPDLRTDPQTRPEGTRRSGRGPTRHPPAAAQTSARRLPPVPARPRARADAPPPAHSTPGGTRPEARARSRTGKGACARVPGTL